MPESGFERFLVLFIACCTLGLMDGFSAEMGLYAANDGVRRDAIKEDYYRKRCQDPTISQQEIFSAYDSLLVCLERQNKQLDRIDVGMQYGRQLKAVGNYVDAVKQYEQTRERIGSLDTLPEILWNKEKNCLYSLGILTMNMGLYLQSIDYFFSIIEKDTKDLDYVVKAYANLSLLFTNMHQEQQALNYLGRAGSIVDTARTLRKSTCFSFFNSLAGWYYVTGKYDSAALILNKAEALAQEDVDFMVCNSNLANIYMSIDEFDLAKDCLNKIISLLSDTSFLDYSQVMALVNLGYIYGLEEDYDMAISYYRWALSLARRMGSKKAEATVYVEMSDLYEKKHQYATALQSLKRGMNLRDSLLGLEQMENIGLLSQEYMKKEKELQMNLLESELSFEKLANRHKTTMLGIFWFCLILLVFSFCWALYSLLKQRDKARKSVMDMEEQNREHQMYVEEKSKRLASANLQKVQAAEIIAESKLLVKKMRYQKSSEYQESIEQLERVLDTFNQNSAWDEFEMYFNQLQPSFIPRLLKSFPDLNRMELRTCALIMLNFSAKEMAQIMHRSVRTIEASVYQIRKKMNVPSDVRTLNFLQTYAEKKG